MLHEHTHSIFCRHGVLRIFCLLCEIGKNWRSAIILFIMMLYAILRRILKLNTNEQKV